MVDTSTDCSLRIRRGRCLSAFFTLRVIAASTGGVFERNKNTTYAVVESSYTPVRVHVPVDLV